MQLGSDKMEQRLARMEEKGRRCQRERGRKGKKQIAKKGEVPQFVRTYCPSTTNSSMS
jgi:ubiquitin